MADASTHTYHLLLVDDNPAELRLMLEAIKDAELDNLVSLSYAYDGEEACDFLNTSRIIDNKVDMILLDLNMPRLNGKDVLSFVKSNTNFSQIPVFIITNSDYRRDMMDCYNLQADGYLQKPSEFKKLVDFFVSVKQSILVRNKLSIFWIEKTYAELTSIA
ncbi:MAG: response regulator [Chitinophagales bacterium]|nr:response regulator [Chitinophagales bacterium]